ncbi:MAG: 50S ribosomal protein L32 [Candidatus Paceibacterota bacterium]|jgi:large subunit ribosomal protein L32
MVVRMRHTRAHTRNRRSHHALVEGSLSKCEKCSAPHLTHRACPNCGTYRGRQVLDVTKKILKKEKKAKAASAAKK